MPKQLKEHPFPQLIEHPFPFMVEQSPTNDFSSNHDERSTFEVQSFASFMETVNLLNPNAFHDYETYQYHEAMLHPMRNNIEFANARILMPQYHCLLHPITGFLGSQRREDMVWPYSHYNLQPPRGRLVSMAKDPRGSRLLQMKIDEFTEQENHEILEELKDHLYELMKHPYGHFVILKLFQSSNISIFQKNTLISSIVFDRPKLRDVCLHDLGNRVIQQILVNFEILISIDEITYAMRNITAALMKNFNGGYVIQQFLELFQYSHKNAIFDVIAEHCYDIAINRNGCCIIQKCMEHQDVPAFSYLVDNLISNAENLAKDSYGKLLQVNAKLIWELHQKYVELSTNKYASNVVEYLLKFSRTCDATFIVEELIQNPNFLQVVQHPYGNYVVQRGLQYSEGLLHERLCGMILSNDDKVNSSIHGKMVVRYAKACRRRRRGFGNRVCRGLYMI